MGLIWAGLGAITGTLADQWKEYFVCDSLPQDVLAVKGQKQTSRRSSNRFGSDNVITNGSGIAVADGQCMIIVEQGKVVEVCAEPGLYTYDSSTEPSIFSGNLGTAILDTFKTIGKRFTYGGGTGNDQRVYYFNTKEMMDNKFGTPTPIPFRVVDNNIGLDIDVSVRCSGVYSYRMDNPILFYANVCGNVEENYTRDQIENQMKTEFISALQPAFAKISELQIRPNALPAHASELADAMNEELTKKWLELRGLSVVSVALNPINLTEEDADLIKQAQKAAILRDPTMAAAQLAGAQADAMRAAAGNSAGAMTGFMGMGMAGQAGGFNAQDLFAMGAQQRQAAQNNGGAAQQPAGGQPQNGQQASGGSAAQTGAAGSPGNTAGSAWTCPSCGQTDNTGKFCLNCGQPKPAASPDGWTCPDCGTLNKGKFCSNCGRKKPAGVPTYKCDKCGWEPEDPTHPPKFCPNCGDPFDENDAQ